VRSGRRLRAGSLHRALRVWRGKAWIAYSIATNEIASRHRVDLDTTITTLAQTGKDMGAKYKETSEGGLAANLVLC